MEKPVLRSTLRPDSHVAANISFLKVHMLIDDTDHEKVRETECSQEQPSFIEIDEITDPPKWDSYSCPRQREALRALDRPDESQTETLRSPPQSCE